MHIFRLALALLPFLVAAPAAAAPRPQPAKAPAVRALEASPASLELAGSGSLDRVFVTAIRADGSRADVSAQAQFSATGAVQVSPTRTVVATRQGAGQLTIAYGGARVAVPVRVRAVSAPPVSFRYDVLPILSRAGCNQGTCHGNGEGRGGLKLSLKGEDPVGDFDILIRQGGGRRVNRVEPGGSLLLRKATAAMPHGGGRRFPADSPEYALLARWIAEGARDDAPEAPRLVKLELTPREAVLTEPARLQRLGVRARFSDGSLRNVAPLAVYNAGDPLVQVSEDGLVRFDNSADVAVLVRYADQMENVRLTYVPARRSFAWKPVPPQNWVDEVNFRRLKLLRLQPSEVAPDSVFLRRAYLDALGVLPTPAETRAFLQDQTPDKRSRLIEALLQRPEFDDFWTMKWGDVLRLEERTLDPKGSAAYRQWIRDSIAGKKPLDQFARELLTATGSTYANPPANYYRRTRTALELAENTAQVFMGTRMLCAKCHNHPFERWKQDDYYTLAAFFARVDRKGEFTRKDRFDLHELIGEETIGVAEKGSVELPRTGRPAPARIYAPGQAGSDTPPVAAGQDPRVVFADWLTRPDNPFFARAAVNRIWFHLMGRGLVDPVDDLRESNPAANPELLDRLAADFRANGYDLRHVVRTVMNSRTYQLSAEPNVTNADDDRFFSRALPQRLGAEVLLDAVSQVLEAPERFAGYPDGTRAVNLIPVKQRHPFLKLFGQPQRESVCECERAGETTLGQSFALISGELVHAKLKVPGNRVGRLLAAGAPDAEIIGELYLAAYSREPTSPERDQALAYLRGKKDRREALEDLAWALVNSKEFLLRR
jgi:hypothetical protein